MVAFYCLGKCLFLPLPFVLSSDNILPLGNKNKNAFYFVLHSLNRIFAERIKEFGVL